MHIRWTMTILSHSSKRQTLVVASLCIALLAFIGAFNFGESFRHGGGYSYNLWRRNPKQHYRRIESTAQQQSRAYQHSVPGISSSLNFQRECGNRYATSKQRQRRLSRTVGVCTSSSDSIGHDTETATVISESSNDIIIEEKKKQVTKDFLAIGVPAFIQLAAEPLASLVDTAYLGRLGPATLGGAGIAISAHYAVSKLYNDPLLRTSISLVASASGATASMPSVHSKKSGNDTSIEQ